MAAYISKKNSWLRCIVSFFPAAGVAALLCYLFAGPNLGAFYDFLLRRRPAPQISHELLIIDSSVPGQELGDGILEPGAAASLLYTLTELGAKTLIIQVPILGLSAGGTVGEAEILYRFDEEFSLLSRNIRNLFDAIRTGSVAPSESARYVGELVELSESGKERLVSALVYRDKEGITSMEKAAAFFGHVRRPGDLQVQLIMTGQGERPGVLSEKNEYSRVRPDRDGVLRRIAPTLVYPELSEGERTERTLEHIIYGALKARYETSEIEYIDPQSINGSQYLSALNGPDGKDIFIPLDRNGMVIFEVPHRGGDFRRIGILDFLTYDDLDKELRRLLSDGEALGLFQAINGENNPLFLYDYALSLREELASQAAVLPYSEERKMIWVDARNSYFRNLDNFLYGPAEMNLVGGYEQIIASEYLGYEEIAKISEMRDSLIRTFISLRAKYNEVVELRNKLESALFMSFCILGRATQEGEIILPVPRSRIADTANGGPRYADAMPMQTSAADTGNSPAWEAMSSFFRSIPESIARKIRSAFFLTNPTDVEASALLANSILTGRVIRPGGFIYLLLGALASALLVCFSVKSMRPISTLWAGTLLILLVGLIFSISFIFSGIWLPPLVPVAAGATALLVSFTWVMITKARYSRQFRLAFSPFVSHACLRSVIRAGKPLPSQVAAVRAAVVVVKNFDLTTPWDSLSPYARAVIVFHEKASDLFRKAGGTIIGSEGDLVTACFGSPLERVFLGGKRNVSPYDDNIHALAAPALRAADIVTEIAKRSECASWHFGIDLGKCTFLWTESSGYFALGYPVQRAKILARLAGRYNARVIISSAVNEALPDQAVKKLDVLKDKDAPDGEPFYRMTV